MTTIRAKNYSYFDESTHTQHTIHPNTTTQYNISIHEYQYINKNIHTRISYENLYQHRKQYTKQKLLKIFMPLYHMKTCTNTENNTLNKK